MDYTREGKSLSSKECEISAWNCLQRLKSSVFATIKETDWLLVTDTVTHSLIHSLAKTGVAMNFGWITVNFLFQHQPLLSHSLTDQNWCCFEFWVDHKSKNYLLLTIFPFHLLTHSLTGQSFSSLARSAANEAVTSVSKIFSAFHAQCSYAMDKLALLVSLWFGFMSREAAMLTYMQA